MLSFDPTASMLKSKSPLKSAQSDGDALKKEVSLFSLFSIQALNSEDSTASSNGQCGLFVVKELQRRVFFSLSLHPVEGHIQNRVER